MPSSVSPLRADFSANRSTTQKSFAFDMRPKKNKSTFDLQMINGISADKTQENSESTHEIDSDSHRLQLVKQKSHQAVFRSQIEITKFSQFRRQGDKQTITADQEDDFLGDGDIHKMEDDEDDSDDGDEKIKL